MYRRAMVLFLFYFVAGSVIIAWSQQQLSPDSRETIKPNAVVIAIPFENEFYLGKTRVPQADLPAKLKEAMKDKTPEDQIVYIKAAFAVHWGTVVAAIDMVRAAGFDRIGLVADKKKTGDARQKLSATNSSSPGFTALPNLPAIQIEVTSKSRVKLDSKPMSISTFGSHLHKLLAIRSDKTAFLKAPGKMSYGDVTKVIDIARAAGAQPLGMDIDRPE